MHYYLSFIGGASVWVVQSVDEEIFPSSRSMYSKIGHFVQLHEQSQNNADIFIYIYTHISFSLRDQC